MSPTGTPSRRLRESGDASVKSFRQLLATERRRQFDRRTVEQPFLAKYSAEGLRG